MSKRKTTPTAPQKQSKPVVKASPIKSSNAVQRAREARDARKFFVVLGIGTVLLVLFLYFIFVGGR
jgi:uncharacterized integral membrane protein